MLSRWGVAGLVLLFAAPAPAAEVRPMSIQVFRLDDVLSEDGTMVQTMHLETAVANDEAARRQAQQPMSFSDAVEQLELVEAYTRKPDGRRVAVEPRAVRVQLAPGVPNVPAYSDRKQMVVVFPEVQGGDVLVATWRKTVLHPVFAGQFTLTSVFNRVVPWDDAMVTVTTPADKPLKIEAHGPVLEEERLEDGRHLYRWHYAAPVALGEDPAAVSPLQRAPRLVASTFPDWPSVASAYAELFYPQAAVTPKIQALADEITAGTADKREQARLLYTWVSRRIRWVAIYLGNDPWVPHAAEAVLANGYGDCKDQAVLLVALMHAKGIAAEAVLININPLYELSGPAVISFDHCITYLPEWDLYADTTAAGAPFGTVGFAEYGKPLLHVRAGGAPPDRVPPVAPEVAVQALRTVATLEADGAVVGTSANEAHGPYATALRSAGRTIAAQGSAKAAAAQLRSLGEPGEGSFTLPEDEAMGPDYRVEGTFKLEAHPEWLEGEGFRMPTGLRLLARTGDLLIGPVRERKLPATEPTPCHAGRSEETLSLTLPPGYRPARMPKNTTVSGSFFHYESRFGFADGVVTARRSLVSSFDQAFCAGAQREEAARGLAAIRRDLGARLSLERIADP